MWSVVFNSQGDQKYNYNDTVQKLCEKLSDDQTFSETTFRWFDGIVVESNTYDTFDPWTIFSTLTRHVFRFSKFPSKFPGREITE